jgi:flagellar protein FliS
MTASPAKLVSMLYDKVTLSLKEAIAAIEAGEVEARWRANARAMEILSHMWSTLDVEKGGEIAQNLESLFSFMLTRLPEVDLRNDPEPAREVISLLEPLRESWRELAKRELTPAPGAYGQQSTASQGSEEDRPSAPASTSFSA